MPTFRRPALDGTLVDSAALRGEVVVLELFAENCVPCRTSLPAAERAHLERPSARFVGISEDDDAAGAARMAALYGLSFPVIHDAGRVLAGRLRVSELPVTVIADARGIVRWVGTRAHETEELVQVIDQIARTRD